MAREVGQLLLCVSFGTDSWSVPDTFLQNWTATMDTMLFLSHIFLLTNLCHASSRASMSWRLSDAHTWERQQQRRPPQRSRKRVPCTWSGLKLIIALWSCERGFAHRECTTKPMLPSVSMQCTLRSSTRTIMLLKCSLHRGSLVSELSGRRSFSDSRTQLLSRAVPRTSRGSRLTV